jgi:hypothetical protein
VRTFGTAYLIVANYIYNTGTTTDDVLNLWVNTALGGSEGPATIPNVTSTATDATTIGAFFLRQGTASSAFTQQVDAILTGTTWASVTPLAGGTTATLANLSPQSSRSVTQGTATAVLAGFSMPQKQALILLQ